MRYFSNWNNLIFWIFYRSKDSWSPHYVIEGQVLSHRHKKKLTSSFLNCCFFLVLFYLIKVHKNVFLTIKTKISIVSKFIYVVYKIKNKIRDHCITLLSATIRVCQRYAQTQAAPRLYRRRRYSCMPRQLHCKYLLYLLGTVVSAVIFRSLAC